MISQDFLLYNFAIMLKKLLVRYRALLGCAAFICAIVFVTYKEHGAALKYKAGCQETVSPVVIPFLPKEYQSSSAKCQDPKEYMPWGYELFAWPEGITTWALIATLFVVGWQARLMGKHAEHFEELARATSDQVKVMQTAERAWLLVNMGPFKLEYKRNPNVVSGVLFLSPIVTNGGRNPAHIQKMYVRARFMKSITELTYPPIYEEEPGDLFGGRRFLSEEDILTIPNQVFQPVSASMDARELDELNFASKRDLYVYGYVQYRTIGNPVCVTRFCFKYHIPEGASHLPEGFIIFGPTGPDGYNRAT